MHTAGAFLAVWTEPGESVQLEEFQDWYEHEHIPLRMNYLPSFLTGARFRASDGQSPSWLAVYDVENTSTFTDESYTRLRLHRSAREADLLKRLRFLDRKTYELVHDTGESDLTSSFRCANPTKALVTHEFVLRHFDSVWWEANVLNSLESVEGWVRTRVFRSIETRKVGVNGADSLPQRSSTYLALHELIHRHHLEAFDLALHATGLTSSMKKSRKWQLHRVYPGLSQRSISSE